MVNTRPSRAKGQLVRRSSQKPGETSSPGLSPKASVKSPAKPKQASGAVKKESKEKHDKAAPKSAKKPQRVRVWWPPTKDKKKTDYSGAYWPATVVGKVDGGYEVQYDNRDIEKVAADNIFPFDVPVDFGEEANQLEVGEYCEVSNNSKTDPAAWLARVVGVEKKTYVVEYPFHDAKPEPVKPQHHRVQGSLVRRARVFELSSKTWKLIQPFQTWEDGEVTSPVELALIPEKELTKYLKEGAKDLKKDKGDKFKVKGKENEKDKKASRDKPSQRDEEEEGDEEEESEPEQVGRFERKKEPQPSAPLPQSFLPTHMQPTGPSQPGGLPGTLIPFQMPDGQLSMSGMQPMSLPPGMHAMGIPPGLPPGTQLYQLPPNVMVLNQGQQPGTRGGPWLVMTNQQSPRPTMPGGVMVPQPMLGPQAGHAFEHGYPQSFGMQSVSALGQMPPPHPSPLPEIPIAPVAPPAPMAMPVATPEPDIDNDSDNETDRKLKRKKDPHAPKKPLSAYLVFMNKFRPDVIQNNPDLHTQEVTKKLAEMWKNVSKEVRDECETAAVQDKKRYEDEMKGYVPPPDIDEAEVEQPARKRKKDKDKDAPLKPRTAYILFSVDFRRKLDSKEVSFNDATKLAAEAWRAASQEAKEHYERLANAEKERYKKEIVEYNRKMGFDNLAAGLRTAAASYMSMNPSETAGASGSGPTNAAISSAFWPGGSYRPGAPNLSAYPTIPNEILPGMDIDRILNTAMDLKKARERITKFYTNEAYVLLLDAWRRDSPRLSDALRSYRNHIMNKQRPDWRLFLVGIFGREQMQKLEKKKHDAEKEDVEAAAAAVFGA